MNQIIDIIDNYSFQRRNKPTSSKFSWFSTHTGGIKSFRFYEEFLTQGKLSGMANWTRWGEAKLETKYEYKYKIKKPSFLFEQNFLLDVIESN